MDRPFPMPIREPAAAGLDATKLDRLCASIEQHVAQGLYPGATVAVARRGHLVLDRTFGTPDPGGSPAGDGPPLWLLYSNTKVINAATLWRLCEDGLLGFGDTVAHHLPDFARHGKGDITLLELLTHQGGFPSATVPPALWSDRDQLRRTLCDIELEWAPGSRIQYHPIAAHWTAAMVIEAVTGRDYQDVIRETIVAPLGLDDEIMVGVRPDAFDRTVPMWEPDDGGGLRARALESTPAYKRAGVPGGGGFATARAMAAFYQALIGGGELGGRRILAPRTIGYATRDFTGDRVDEDAGEPMHWGLGPRRKGLNPVGSALGSLAPPEAFGHGGVGSSFCWGDPTSGVSFAFLSNARQSEASHNGRMERFGNLVHAAILGG